MFYTGAVVFWVLETLQNNNVDPKVLKRPLNMKAMGSCDWTAFGGGV